MAKTLSKEGIIDNSTIEAWHVTQSIDALTGDPAYDITISGSLTVTGSITGTPGTTNPLTSSYAITASYAINASDSDFTAAGISGSLGTNATLIRSLTAAGISGSWQAQTSSMTVATASYAGQLYGSPNIIVSSITSSGDVHIADLKYIRIDGSGRSGAYANRFTINHSVDTSGYFQVHSGSGATVVSSFASKTGGGSGIALGDGSNGGSGINDLKVYGNSLFTSHITSSTNIKIDGTISNVSTTHVTASGDISASVNVYGDKGYFPSRVTTDTIYESTLGSGTSFKYNIIAQANITASANISSSGTGSFEQLMMNYDNMPTSDPGIKGVIWRSSTDLKISAG